LALPAAGKNIAQAFKCLAESFSEQTPILFILLPQFLSAIGRARRPEASAMRVCSTVSP
jgi:hypothetical protein